MAARAPKGIEALWHRLDKLMPAAVLSGIVGDAAHTYGYHCSRAELPRSDYSVKLPADRRGPPDAAAALDVSYPPKQMKLVTARLVRAAKRGDPRVARLREFCGTLNGRQTYPWQIHPASGSEGVDSWDDSHLWHVHLSMLRQYVDDGAGYPGVADVMAGRGDSVIRRAVDNVKAGPSYPLKGRGLFGPITGGPRMHGGYYPANRPHIRWIQLRLIALGYVPGIRPGTPAARSWADGRWTAPTSAAVHYFKVRNGIPPGDFIGRKAWRLLHSRKVVSA